MHRVRERMDYHFLPGSKMNGIPLKPFKPLFYRKLKGEVGFLTRKVFNSDKREFRKSFLHRTRK